MSSVRALPGTRPRLWAIAALALSALGVLAATWIVVGSDGDPSQVRWPLVVLPVLICALPVLVPRRSVWIGAAIALAAWCVVATLSIGFLLWPALVALLVASSMESS